MSILVAHGVEVPCSLHGAGNFPDIASVNSPNVQPRHAILRLIFIWPQALCQLDQFEQSMHVPMQLHHESERQGSLTSLNGPQIKRTVEKQLWGLHWVQIDILRKSFNRVTFESLDPCHKYWSCLLGCPSEEAKCRVQNRTNMGTAGWVNHPELSAWLRFRLYSRAPFMVHAATWATKVLFQVLLPEFRRRVFEMSLVARISWQKEKASNTCVPSQSLLFQLFKIDRVHLLVCHKDAQRQLHITCSCCQVVQLPTVGGNVVQLL